MQTIKDTTGTTLYESEVDSLRECVVLAVKMGTDLRYANLHGADLHGSDLRDSQGINAWRVTPLRCLYDQPGSICAYKLVTQNGEGPYNGGIVYEVGKTIVVDEADTDEHRQCAKGINLATADWCMRNWQPSYRILIVQFTAQDIAAIPFATDGKFRVRRCKVVGEKDLAELGLVAQGGEEARERGGAS